MNVTVSNSENGKRTMVADAAMYGVITEALRFTANAYRARNGVANGVESEVTREQDRIFIGLAESIITACHEPSKVNDGHTSG